MAAHLMCFVKWCHKKRSTDSCNKPDYERYEVRTLEDL